MTGEPSAQALRPTITACLIVQDEEREIAGALESVAFCDEVVVVDSGSTDRTLEIARASGAVVVENPWPGFAKQRNVAARRATSEWILEVDADERITPELAREIRAFLADPELGGRYDIAALPMTHRFLGRQMHGTTKYPGYRYRLFRRGAYEHDEARTVHEGLWATSPAWAMRSDMTHELAHSLRQALVDLRSYTRLEASQFSAPRSPKAVVVGVLLRPAAKLAYRVVVDRALRDGWRGALKLAMDTAGDIAVWGIALRRGSGAGGPADGLQHFSHEPEPSGSLRLVGVATTPAGSVAAERWLAAAKEQGTDVVLLTATPEAVVTNYAPAGGPGMTASAIRVEPLTGGSTLAILRGLDAERQVRQIDALLLGEDGTRPKLKRLRTEQVGRAAPASTTEPVADGLARIGLSRNHQRAAA